MVAQHFAQRLGVLGGEPQPAADRLVLVARDLLGRPQAAPTTTTSERLTSSGGVVCSRYIGVSWVSPNQTPQPPLQ